MLNLNIKDQFKEDIKKKYAHKSQDIIKLNIQAFDAGMNMRTKLEKTPFLENFSIERSSKKLIMSGCEAMAFGLWSQMQVLFRLSHYPGYRNYGISCSGNAQIWRNVLQCEDEISAITAALGASFSGDKSMTATSGPGFSLMSEAIGLASMAELPVVIMDVQRGGPSTGLPTKTEQSDLNLAIYGTHGDTPKIVLCSYQRGRQFLPDNKRF